MDMSSPSWYGYKEVDAALVYEGYRFQVGQTHICTDELPNGCAGFRYCEFPTFLRTYHVGNYPRYIFIKAGGDISREIKQSYATHITVLREMTWDEMVADVKLRYPGKIRISFDDGKLFVVDGLPHREQKPAIVSCDRYEWYRHGKRHRDGAPAVICRDTGTQAWFQNGHVHRTRGPAIIFNKGDEDEEKLWVLHNDPTRCSSVRINAETARRKNR